MLITKDGVKDDGKNAITILFNSAFYTIADLAATDGQKYIEVSRKVTRHLNGKLDFKDICSDDFWQKPRVTSVGDRQWTYISLMEATGCKKQTAMSRLNRFRKGEITAKAVTEPPRSDGYVNRLKGSKPITNTAAERNLIDKIPNGGTWEEANLTPGTFVDCNTVNREY